MPTVQDGGCAEECVSEADSRRDDMSEKGSAVDTLVRCLLTPFSNMMLPKATATQPRRSAADDDEDDGAAQADGEAGDERACDESTTESVTGDTPFATPEGGTPAVSIENDIDNASGDDGDDDDAQTSAASPLRGESGADALDRSSECQNKAVDTPEQLPFELMPCLEGLGALNIHADDDDDEEEGAREEETNVARVEESVEKQESRVRASSSTALRSATTPPAPPVEHTNADPFIINDEIRDTLYAHQLEGVRWLWRLHTSGRAHVAGKRHGYGGILADDMGMGKTLQVCAFISAVTRAAPMTANKPPSERTKVMVLMPKSLIKTWKRELRRCGVRHEVFTDAHTKEQALNKVLTRGGVLLSTYGMVQHNAALLSAIPLETSKWSWVVLDEGHEIKNHKSQLAEKVRTIPCERRLLITATPVQNNLRELWSLYDFACPGLLGDEHSFKSNFEKAIGWGVDKNANPRELHVARTASERLRSLYAPHYLRRTKEDLRSGELPNKSDIVVWLRMTPAQVALYTSFLESSSVRSALTKNAGGGNTLTAITLMQKICCSPEMVRKESEAEIGRSLGTYSASDSVKVRFVLDLLGSLYSDGHRTLVFSNSTKFLDIIERELSARTSLGFLRVDGSVTSPDERQSRVDAFNADTAIAAFLLTTRVGGVGITLTGADRVILMDPSWNPMVDNQAVDRAYRIGQTRDVIVYRLMTAGTVEEKQYQRQVFKGALSRTSSREDDQYRYFSSEDLRVVFSSSEDGMRESETQRKLEKLHSGERRVTEMLELELARVTSDDAVAGVSDHDLLFSKEAQKEYGGGVETSSSSSSSSSRFSTTPHRKRNGGGFRYGSKSRAVAGPVWVPPVDAIPLGKPTLLDAAAVALTPSKKKAARPSATAQSGHGDMGEGEARSVSEGRAKSVAPLTCEQPDDIDRLIVDLKKTEGRITSYERLLSDVDLVSRLLDGGAKISKELGSSKAQAASIKTEIAKRCVREGV